MSASGGQWQQDAQGRWYSVEANGKKFYNAPTFKEQATSRPGDSFLRNTAWDTDTGTWKKTINWGNIIGLAAMAPTGIAAGQALAGAGVTAASTGAASTTAGGAAVAPTAAGAAGGGMHFGLGTLANLFNGGAQLVGGAMQAHAQNKAADVQAKAAADALAFAKQQYAKAVQDYAPYLQASQAQIPGLTDFLNQTRPPQGGYPVDGQPPVMMRAPNGQTKPIPPDQVPHYTTMGATVIS